MNRVRADAPRPPGRGEDRRPDAQDPCWPRTRRTWHKHGRPPMNRTKPTPWPLSALPCQQPECVRREEGVEMPPLAQLRVLIEELFEFSQIAEALLRIEDDVLKLVHRGAARAKYSRTLP